MQERVLACVRPQAFTEEDDSRSTIFGGIVRTRSRIRNQSSRFCSLASLIFPTESGEGLGTATSPWPRRRD